MVMTKGCRLPATFEVWKAEKHVAKRNGTFFVAETKNGLMKVYLLFFVTYTLMQILFTGFYLIMVQHIDMTLVMGAAIYLMGMYQGYQSYQYFRYRQKRKELLDSLPF